MITARCVFLLSLAACWTASASPARADDAEKAFYAGKTVRMIVGSGVGGGYDIFSRLIAPYLARTLAATVIVENQPGAGGLVALNRLYAAAPDGLQISLSNGTGAAFAQLTGDQAARFDLAKFTYLSTVGAPPGLWLVGPNSPIREVQQAVDARMKWRWASSGGTSGLGIGAAFTCEALKLDCHVVQGYKGSADAGLAVTRGEMDALYVPESSANNFVKAKQNWALATISRERSRFFQDRPTIFEAVRMDADGTWVMDFLANVEKLGRILIAPPGIPPARLAHLQDAVKETLHNPQLIADGERAERIIEYLDPASTHRNAVAVVGGVTAEQKARVLKILSGAK
jgi:tripartite-type tricarboxylate transporter receptor subunit TctC